MTVVYIDSVFALNAAMDYFVLLLTARLAGLPLRRRRYLLSSLLGGGYAAAVFLPGCGFLSALPVKCAAGVLLALLAFGGEGSLGRLTLLFFAVSCALAGCVLALGLLAGQRVPMAGGVFYTDVNLKVLLIAAGGAYLVLAVSLRAAARFRVEGRLIPVRICVLGRVTELTALRDTGNALRDGGRPVLVITPGAAALPGRLRSLLTAERLRAPADLLEPLVVLEPALRPRLLPYRAVGVEGGLLLTVESDWVEAAGVRWPHSRLALSPTELGDGYQALWSGEVRKGGNHGASGTMPSSAGPAGPAA